MRWFAAAIITLGAFGTANAGSSALLEDGKSITVGDATITVESCSSTASTTFCTNGSVQFAAAPGPNEGFVIESVSSPGVTAFLPAGDDITVMFEVATATKNITSIGLITAGTGNASTGETDNDSNFCGIGSGTAMAGHSTKISLNYGSPCNSPTEKDIFITKDMNAHSGSLIAVTQYIDAVGAPEPFSGAMLLVGLAGLGAVRRRRR